MIKWNKSEVGNNITGFRSFLKLHLNVKVKKKQTKKKKPIPLAQVHDRCSLRWLVQWVGKAHFIQLPDINIMLFIEDLSGSTMKPPMEIRFQQIQHSLSIGVSACSCPFTVPISVTSVQ